MNWQKIAQISLSILLSWNLILPGFNLPQKDFFVLSPISSFAEKSPQELPASEAITKPFLESLADIARVSYFPMSEENFLEKLKAASSDKNFNLPRSFELSNIRSYEEKIPGAFLVEFKANSNRYVLLVAPTEPLYQAWHDGKVIPIPHKEFQGTVENYTYLFYDSVTFQEEPDWFFYLKDGEGKFVISNVDQINETPTISLEVKGQLRKRDEKTLGPNLLNGVKKLVHALVRSPELRMIPLWERDIKGPGPVKRSSGRLALPKAEPSSLQLVVEAPETIRLGRSQSKESTLIIPSLLFRTSHLKYFPHELETGREFIARYGVRQMRAQELYGVQSDAAVQTLILLEWFEDFIHLEEMEQEAVVGLLQEILPGDQKEILALFIELKKEDSPTIDETLAERTLEFVRQALLPKKEEDQFLDAHPDFIQSPSPEAPLTKDKEKEEVLEAWDKIQAPDRIFRTFFDGVKTTLPADTQLQYLLILSRGIPDLAKLIEGYVVFLKELEEDQNGAKEKTLEKALKTIHENTSYAPIRRDYYEKLRRIVFRALYELTIEKGDRETRTEEHLFLYDLIRTKLDSKTLPLEHAVDYWLDLCLAHAQKLHYMASATQTSSEKIKGLSDLITFLFLMDKRLGDWKDIPHFFLKAEQVQEMLEKIKKEKKEIESADPSLTQEAHDPLRIRYEKIINRITRAVERKHALQEQKEEVLQFFASSLNQATTPALQELSLFLKANPEQEKSIERYYKVLAENAENPQRTVNEIADRIFRDEISAILTAVVTQGVQLKDGTTFFFSGEQFYQMLLLVSQAYEGEGVKIPTSFCDTELYSYLKNVIVQDDVNSEFKVAFSKFMERTPPIAGLIADENEPIEKLFEWYSSMLLCEQYSGRQPYAHQVKARKILRDKIEKRTEEIKGESGPSLAGRLAGGLLSTVKSLVVSPEFYTFPAPEFEKEVEGIFLNGINAMVDQKYDEASREFQNLLKTIVKFYKREREKFEALVQQRENEKKLTALERYDLENEFYQKFLPARFMYKSALAALKYILKENTDHKAFGKERLSISEVESLSTFLEKRPYKHFLKKVLPAIEEIQIRGEKKRVRVYDFLEIGEGGKEGEFQKLRYVFFGSRIYDFLGYYRVEVPEGKNGNFNLKHYVAKLAQTPRITQSYNKLFAGYFKKFRSDTERFENNHFKEKFINSFIKAFQQFLEEKAKEFEKAEEEQKQEAEKFREYAELLDIPAIVVSENISSEEDPEKSIDLLMIEFVSDLFEMAIPKTTFAPEADKDGVLHQDPQKKKSVDWILEILKGQFLEAERKKGRSRDLDITEKRAEQRFEKMRALSVVLNTLLRNVDYGPFVSKQGLAILDMEGTFPQVFSSRFNLALEDGDWIMEEGGHIVDIKKPARGKAELREEGYAEGYMAKKEGPQIVDIKKPADAKEREELQKKGYEEGYMGKQKEDGSCVDIQKPARGKEELQKEGYKKHDPNQFVDTFFTWRLNNVFIKAGDAKEKNFKRIYQPLINLACEFLLTHPSLDYQGLSGQDKNIDLSLRRIRDSLEEDVKMVVRGMGVAYLNGRGDVIPAKIRRVSRKILSSPTGSTTRSATIQDAAQATIQEATVPSEPKDMSKTINLEMSPSEAALAPSAVPAKGELQQFLEEIFGGGDKPMQTSPTAIPSGQEDAAVPAKSGSARLKALDFASHQEVAVSL